MQPSPAYLPGSQPGKPPGLAVPLGRFLPLIPEGVSQAWLGKTLPGAAAGAWILDPFGAAPTLVWELARAGCQVLVAANNPVARFYIEIGARPFKESDLRAALAELSAAYKAEERLEVHLRSLYITHCHACHSDVEAEAFIWERGGAAPAARIYACPTCGEAGEFPTTKFDLEQASQWKLGGPQRARVLQRIAPIDDPDRAHAEEALEVYPPRAVHALFSLINKLPSVTPTRRKAAEALLLSAFDQANALWPAGGGRARPRQLTLPNRYRENNVWLALERSVQSWALLDSAPLPVVNWPDLPPGTGGICLFEGRAKELNLGDSQVHIAALVTALPRPNQAYWTLSALWSAWLWGREAAAPFKSVLRRRRYDWPWHATALHNALSGARARLAADIPALALVSEAEAGLLTAAVAAGSLAGFQLTGIALRAEDEQAQIHWLSVSPASPEPDLVREDSPPQTHDQAHVYAALQSEGQAYLHQRGEPAPYLYLHAAGLQALARDPQASGWDTPAEAVSRSQAAYSHALSYQGRFLRYGGSENSLDAGLWWIETAPAADLEVPLADRVEIALVKVLIQQPGLERQMLETMLCEQFPGLFTPDRALITALLESYGQEDEARGWSLRSQDAPRQRRSELDEMERLLVDLGSRLDYQVQSSISAAPLQWLDAEGRVRYAFFLQASAVLGRTVFTPPQPPTQGVIVYPGSRAGLVHFKLRRDPHLAAFVERSWRLVKFRHVRRMAEDPLLTRQNFPTAVERDPVTNRDPQMSLL
jgi:hypothetical protein